MLQLYAIIAGAIAGAVTGCILRGGAQSLALDLAGGIIGGWIGAWIMRLGAPAAGATVHVLLVALLGGAVATVLLCVRGRLRGLASAPHPHA